MVATLTRTKEEKSVEDLLDFGYTGQSAEAHFVENQLAEQQNPWRNSETLRKRIPEIEALRGLQEGWDGRDAEAPSDDVVSHAEVVWLLIDNELPRGFARPTVKMSRDGFVSFSWIVPNNKELHIWIHDDETVWYELHLRRSTGKPVDIDCASPDDLMQAVAEFFKS